MFEIPVAVFEKPLPVIELWVPDVLNWSSPAESRNVTSSVVSPLTVMESKLPLARLKSLFDSTTESATR